MTDSKQRPSLVDIGETAMRIHDILRESHGELTPETEAALDSLLATGADALDAAAWALRQLAADEQTCKDEADRYFQRVKSYKGQQDSLKGRMLFAVEAAFGGKLKTARNTIWSQTSAATVGFEIAPDADMEKVAQENSIFVRRQYELNKLELKRYYEAGEAIPSEIIVIDNPGKTSLRIR